MVRRLIAREEISGMNFDATLLDTSRGDVVGTTDFNAVLDAHGVYEGMRFVVRLSPRVHALVADLPNGIATRKDVTFEQLQAFSTYLHETIHWWQHIGSSCGLMLSLSYPAQTHANLPHLQDFLKAVGPVKPITAWAAANPGPNIPGSAPTIANLIINNQFDIQAYRFLATNPELAQRVVDDKMFENVAHCYNIALSSNVFALASTFDPDFQYLPDPRDWKEELAKLRDGNEPGYFYGSPVELSPVGALYIFEGQARFAQMQYLYFATGGAFDWDAAEAANMLTRTYMLAFETFLGITKLKRPMTIDHPTIGLFLLVCDIAINPGEAFPFPVRYPKSFVHDVDPGMRFVYVCLVIREKCPETAHQITRYDASEYVQVCDVICRAFASYTPLQIVNEVNRWTTESERFAKCLAFHDQGKSDLANLPLQVLFGQFASFARDKARAPHVFCWPGANMAGDAVNEETAAMFRRQSPMFVDRADDTTIVPVIRQGTNEADVAETFQDFYSGVAFYDMTRQWIVADGPFDYNYKWLQPNGTPEDMKNWANASFTATYQLNPDLFTVLR